MNLSIFRTSSFWTHMFVGAARPILQRQYCIDAVTPRAGKSSSMRDKNFYKLCSRSGETYLVSLSDSESKTEDVRPDEKLSSRLASLKDKWLRKTKSPESDRN